MRMLMLGAGATGGFYGGKLVLAGRDVTFLLRERRAAGIRERGLEIIDHTGAHLVAHPPVITADDLRQPHQPFDLIVISTKAYQLAAAMEDIAPAVGPETMILPILNGMHQLSILDERFGAERVLAGSVRIVSDMDEGGRILQLNPLDEMNYGERSGEQTPRILALDAAMRGAGFTATLRPNIVDTLWQKWVILASMGAICVLGRGDAGQIASAPKGPAMVRAVLQECQEIAAGNGYPADPDLIRVHSQRMLDTSSTLTSSMYRDMCKGAPVEADHILGDLLERASGVATPLLSAAYVQLKVYEATRTA